MQSSDRLKISKECKEEEKCLKRVCLVESEAVIERRLLHIELVSCIQVAALQAVLAQMTSPTDEPVEHRRTSDDIVSAPAIALHFLCVITSKCWKPPHVGLAVLFRNVLRRKVVKRLQRLYNRPTTPDTLKPFI